MHIKQLSKHTKIATLQIKKNEFHKNKIDELIKATENDPKLF